MSNSTEKAKQTKLEKSNRGLIVTKSLYVLKSYYFFRTLLLMLSIMLPLFNTTDIRNKGRIAANCSPNIRGVCRNSTETIRNVWTIYSKISDLRQKGLQIVWQSIRFPSECANRNRTEFSRKSLPPYSARQEFIIRLGNLFRSSVTIWK